MIKDYKKEDLEFIHKWCEHYKFPKLEDEMLPDGWIAYDGDTPVFVGWLYAQADLKIAWVAWVVMNPECDHRARDKAFVEFNAKIDEEAVARGIKMMITPTNNGSLINRFNSNGWQTYDIDVCHLMKMY